MSLTLNEFTGGLLGACALHCSLLVPFHHSQKNPAPAAGFVVCFVIEGLAYRFGCAVLSEPGQIEPLIVALPVADRVQ